MQFQKYLFQMSLVLCCAMLAGRASCAEFNDVAAGDDVVARMGEVELRATEVRKLVEAQSPEVRRQVESAPPALERLLRKELVRRTVLQEARRKEWDKRPEVIQKMDMAREQALLSTYVNSLARPPADYPSEDEIKAAYKDGKDTFKLPSQHNVAQIYVAPPAPSANKADETDQARAVATSAQTRSKQDDSSEPAKMSPERRQGAEPRGDTGRLREGQEHAEVHAAPPAIKTGEVSSAIRTGPSWHIEMKAATVRELADVRESIVQTLRWRKAQENEARYLEDVASRSAIVINQTSLEQALSKR